MKVIYIRTIIESCNNFKTIYNSDMWRYGELPQSITTTFDNFTDAYNFINDGGHFHTPGTYVDETCLRHKKYIAMRKDFHETSSRIYEKDFTSFVYEERYVKIELRHYDSIKTLQNNLSVDDFVEWYKDNIGTICAYNSSPHL